ncbi:MAG: MFS transporter [Chloroflexi bacterium]|nr:MFS transporter [Chloroflexota bacterium]
MSGVRKWLYAVGNLSPSVTGNAVAIYIQFFYVDVLKLSPGLMGLAWALYGIWNSLNEPLAGQLSDMTRTRWGRRIPWIMFGSLPMGVFFALMWLTPASIQQDQTSLFVYLLVLLWLFDAMFTFVVLNYVALFPEMYVRLEDRAEVSKLRQVFGVLGMVLGVALLPLIANTFGWGVMGVAFAVLTTGSLYVSLRGSFETPDAGNKESLPLRQALSATFRNWTFVTYMCAQVMKETGALLLQAGLPFYAKYVLRVTADVPVSVAGATLLVMPAGMVTTILLGTAMVMAFATLSLWARIAVKFGTRAATMCAFAAVGLSLIPFSFVQDVMQTLVAIAVFGLGLGGLNVLPDILLSEVIDEDETKTGVRREGMYFGMQGLLLKAGTVLQGAVLAFLLMTSGYNADLGPLGQPAGVDTGIRLAVSALPAIGFGLGVLFLTLYPLHGKRLAEVQARRARRGGPLREGES